MRFNCSGVQWSACSCVMTTATVPVASVIGVVNDPGSMNSLAPSSSRISAACSSLVSFMCTILARSSEAGAAGNIGKPGPLIPPGGTMSRMQEHMTDHGEYDAHGHAVGAEPTVRGGEHWHDAHDH